ncbi:hypothetical protein [Gluconobacter japonicus]|uniref:hypothetical protein n=1 Tax=Gluconobacter japonicus TaxID=376620 RepID=UPI001B8D1090|nr:hypothetical protein [Gluconobacter japonicus]MBS1050478.1 hypothetical protein [Gluconobacter japonicus]
MSETVSSGGSVSSASASSSTSSAAVTSGGTAVTSGGTSSAATGSASSGTDSSAVTFVVVSGGYGFDVGQQISTTDDPEIRNYAVPVSGE